MNLKHILVFIVFSGCQLLWSQSSESKLKTILTQVDSKKKVSKLNDLSEELWGIGEYQLSMTCAENALKISHQINDFIGEGMAYNNIGIAHDFQGQYAESLDNYFKAIKIQEKNHDERGLAYTYNNIGLIYSTQKNYKDALIYYKKALVIREKIKDSRGLSSIYNNIGIVYMNNGNYDDALKTYLISLELDKKYSPIDDRSACLNNIGLVYFKQKNYKKAIEYFNNSLTIRIKNKDIHGIANSYSNLATLYIDTKQFDLAEDYCQKGLKIGLDIGSKDMIQYSYSLQHQIDEANGDFRKALKSYKLFVAYGDSLLTESDTKKQTESEMQFKFDQIQAQNKLKQEKKDLIELQRKQQQTYILWGLISIILLILIFAWFLNKRWKIEKLQKHLIESQKKVVEQKNQEILASITYAKRIQTAILPADKLVKEYLTDSFILYKPKDIVAGDFYWLEPSEDELIFAVADCTGHGVPGALVSVVCHNALNRSVREFGLKDPAEILNKTREIIIREFEKSDENVNDGMDISICRLNLKTLQLQWSGANSPAWILKSKTLELIEFKPIKQPIGVYSNYLPFETTIVTLEKDDSIYLFSDGFADQFGGSDGKKMKTKLMKQLILDLAETSMSDQKNKMDLYFEKWKGNLDQIDDVCVIGVRV